MVAITLTPPSNLKNSSSELVRWCLGELAGMLAALVRT